MPRASLVRQRSLFLAGFAACVALIAAALYLQYVVGLEPCPLCILQRVAIIVMGVLFLVAALHNPGLTGRRIYAVLLSLTAVTGAAIAGRHVWLEHLPADQVPACGPGLSYILNHFPFARALDIILRGSGECAEVTWRLLGLSIPTWTLAVFIVFAIASIAIFFIRRFTP
jgi:disulfide bond formation protein DsbB